MADRCIAWRSKAKARQLLEGLDVPGILSFSIQNVGNAKQVPWRENMDVDLFGCPGIGMPENDADHVEGYAFSIQFRGEIVPKRMRTEPRYAGFHGKSFTGSVNTIY